MSSNKEYRSISIPQALIKEIEKTLKDFPELGYVSVSDFIRDACREKLEHLRKGVVVYGKEIH